MSSCPQDKTITCDNCGTKIWGAAPSTLKWHKRRSKSCQLQARLVLLRATHVLERRFDRRLDKAIQAISAKHEREWGNNHPLDLRREYAYIRGYRDNWWPKWLVYAVLLGYGYERILELQAEEKGVLQLELDLIVSVGGCPWRDDEAKLERARLYEQLNLPEEE